MIQKISSSLKGVLSFHWWVIIMTNARTEAVQTF